MEEKPTRVAQIGIVVENRASSVPLNALLHEYGRYIIGRMGVPYEKRGVSIISIVLDAPADAISTLAGKIGSLPGVSSKTIYARLSEKEEQPHEASD